MSGMEVLGAISAIIGIIDACVKIYEGAAKDLKLSETFRVVARQLPILADTLNTCKTYLQSKKSAISADVWKALEETLESCEEKACNLRNIFEKVISSEADGWHKRYVKAVHKMGKGNKVEELMTAIIKDVQLVVNHRAVQSTETEKSQQLDEILVEVQKLEPSMNNHTEIGTSFTNWSGKQNVNLGEGPQFNYETMSGTQHFNLVMREKLDFSFVRPVGLYLDQAPCIDSSFFVGRAAEINQMHEVLRPENGLNEQTRLVLGGMGGIGKTQLAIAYAKAHQTDYHSIFWVNATSEATVKASLKSVAGQIFDAQDLHSLTDEQMVAGIKQWLLDGNNKKWLLIFDNYDEPKAYKLSKYYPQTSHGRIIITTRLPDEVGPDVVMVPSLNDIEDCLHILQNRSKRDNVKCDIHARRLAERLAGLPLALVTAGTFLRKDKCTWTFEKYLDEYEKRWNVDPRGRLRVHDYHDHTLYTTWNLSYQRLQREDPEAARMLKLLAYFGRQSICYELFHAGRCDDLPDWLLTVTGDSLDFEERMRVLVEYCFIQVQLGKEAYEMHTCVHDWTLAELNRQIEPWSYWYAFDCVARLIHDVDWATLEHLLFAQYVPHAIRLTHNRFDDVFKEIQENRISEALGISQLLRKQVQLVVSELLMQRILSWQEKALGPNHSSTLETVQYIGFVYYDQDKLKEAEEMHIRAWTGYEKDYTQTLAEHEKALGADHPSTLYTAMNLGTVYDDLDKGKEAEEMHMRAITGFEKTLGIDHKSTLYAVHGLAISYKKQGKLKEAEEMYIRAVAGFEKAIGRDHLSTTATVHNLGILYWNQGKLKEAEEMYIRAVAGYEKVEGEDHPSTLTTIHDLGTIYWNHGKLKEAEETFTRALARCEKALGAVHALTLKVVEALTRVLCERVGVIDGEQSSVAALSHLVQYVDKWSKIHPVVIGYMAKALLKIRDNSNAGIALAQRMKLDIRTPLEFNGVLCDGCQCNIMLVRGCHMCRTCDKVDLCDACMSGHASDGVDIPSCRAHEFFNAGAVVSELLASPDAQQQMDFEAWMDKLKKQYCTECS